MAHAVSMAYLPAAYVQLDLQGVIVRRGGRIVWKSSAKMVDTVLHLTAMSSVLAQRDLMVRNRSTTVVSYRSNAIN